MPPASPTPEAGSNRCRIRSLPKRPGQERPKIVAYRSGPHDDACSAFPEEPRQADRRQPVALPSAARKCPIHMPHVRVTVLDENGVVVRFTSIRLLVARDLNTTGRVEFHVATTVLVVSHRMMRNCPCRPRNSRPGIRVAMLPCRDPRVETIAQSRIKTKTTVPNKMDCERVADAHGDIASSRNVDRKVSHDNSFRQIEFR
jgi:hypothetical protein